MEQEPGLPSEPEGESAADAQAHEREIQERVATMRLFFKYLTFDPADPISNTQIEYSDSFLRNQPIDDGAFLNRFIEAGLSEPQARELMRAIKAFIVFHEGDYSEALYEAAASVIDRHTAALRGSAPVDDAEYIAELIRIGFAQPDAAAFIEDQRRLTEYGPACPSHRRS